MFEIDLVVSVDDVVELGHRTYRITEINEIDQTITLVSVEKEREMMWSDFESIMNNAGKVRIHRDLIEGT